MKILVSFDRHDYKVCGCPNETMIDGGHDYLRCGGKDMSKIMVLEIVKKGRLARAKKTTKVSKRSVK